MTAAPGLAGRPMPYWDGGLFDNTPLGSLLKGKPPACA
jgi:predicted acylesterase/phospholipase RssA